MDSGIVRHRASGNIDIGLLKRSAHWVYGRLLGRTVFLERTAVRLGVDCAAKFVHHPRAYDVRRSGDNLLLYIIRDRFIMNRGGSMVKPFASYAMLTFSWS